ncbi:MAG: hypothetical protein FWD23_00200 [Oscillospiraceae bacterium]|nr:hypothetical protein [Oscillospiraceae bacterium]
MGEIFSVNGKAVGKLYINQIAMSVFGIMVILATAQNDLLVLFASFLAVGLYLFIIYSMMWEQGAKAAAKTLRAEDAGVRKIKTPFLIVLFGSLFNIFCYALYAVMKIYVTVNDITEGGAAFFGNVVWQAMRMLNAIYMGFEALIFPNPNLELIANGETTVSNIMFTPPYFFFITLIPLFATGICAYYLGASEISILKKLGFKTKHRNVSNIHIDYDRYEK